VYELLSHADARYSTNSKPRVAQSTNLFTCRCSSNNNQRLYKVQTSSHAQMYKVVIKTKSGTKYKLSKASKNFQKLQTTPNKKTTLVMTLIRTASPLIQRTLENLK